MLSLPIFSLGMSLKLIRNYDEEEALHMWGLESGIFKPSLESLASFSLMWRSNVCPSSETKRKD